jgi:opacity protein-like surface antigen
MLKKLLIASAILASSTNIALATSSAPYVGVGTGVNVFSSSSGGVYRGVPLNIFGGYGAIINDVYLGGELFGTLGSLTLDNNPSTKASVKSTSGFGLSFIPGVMLADHTLAFARLSLVRNFFSTINSSATGYQLGAGLQTCLTQNWDLRGEYDYTSFNSIGGVSPRSDAFNVGLVYKIN